MALKIFTAFTGCFLLAACMGTAAPEPQQTSNAPLPPPETAASPAPVEAAPVVEETTAPPPPPPEPARLTGLTPAEVQAIMGEPSFVRRDENVQTMLYENADCVFEIIFVEPTSDHHFQAQDMNARTKAGNGTDLAACLTAQLPNGTWLDIEVPNQQSTQ